MKKISLSFLAIMALVISCQRSSNEIIVSQNDRPGDAMEVTAKSNAGPCNPNAYTVTLESRTLVDGHWQWIWSVRNPIPGNGNNGTAQNLSHWGMQVGSCVNWSSIIGAGYSVDGTSWTNFTPGYQVDPSQGCMTTPVLKFDFGTTGSAKTYYRLIIDQDIAPASTLGYYKSGNNTSCCTFNFSGLGCGGPVEIVE